MLHVVHTGGSPLRVIIPVQRGQLKFAFSDTALGLGPHGLVEDGGGGRIRTSVARSAADLQSAAISHSATPPRGVHGYRHVKGPDQRHFSYSHGLGVFVDIVEEYALYLTVPSHGRGQAMGTLFFSTDALTLGTIPFESRFAGACYLFAATR